MRKRRKMPRIEKLYAYIAHEEGDPNDEGVTALQTRGGGWAPMVGADEARMMSLKPAAQEMANVSGISIALVEFSTKTVLETIEPE